MPVQGGPPNLDPPDTWLTPPQQHPPGFPSDPQSPHPLLLLSGCQLVLSVADSEEWRMLLLTLLAQPPRWVYVMCMFSVLSSLSLFFFCRVYVGRGLLSEPHICVNSVCTFEVLSFPVPPPHLCTALIPYIVRGNWLVHKKKRKKIALI